MSVPPPEIAAIREAVNRAGKIAQLEPRQRSLGDEAILTLVAELERVTADRDEAQRENAELSAQLVKDYSFVAEADRLREALRGSAWNDADGPCWCAEDERSDRFRDALAFYADPDVYAPQPRRVRPVITDGGARARAALVGGTDAAPPEQKP